MTTITAKNCYILIERDRYKYDDMMQKLDVFLLNDRITLEEYDILVKFMNEKESNKAGLNYNNVGEV